MNNKTPSRRLREPCEFLDKRLELALNSIDNNPALDLRSKQAQVMAILLNDAKIRDAWVSNQASVIH